MFESTNDDVGALASLMTWNPGEVELYEMTRQVAELEELRERIFSEWSF